MELTSSEIREIIVIQCEKLKDQFNKEEGLMEKYFLQGKRYGLTELLHEILRKEMEEKI